MYKQPARFSLSDFICSNRESQFVIPVYQRNYSWNPGKETRQFMDDVEHLLQTSASHFLGILIYVLNKKIVPSQLMVIDGQQRLTTAFIFLLALRKAALVKGDKKTALKIDHDYIFQKNRDEVRIRPSVAEDDVFASLVYGNENNISYRDSETNVYRNYVYILSRLEELLKHYRPHEILNVLTRLDILAFPLSDEDNVQQIYESINATGAPLTASDLIRNFVLMNYEESVQERLYRMYWKPLEEKAGQPQRLEEFFRYYLAAKTYSLSSRKDLYEDFKAFWQQRGGTTEVKLQEINRYALVNHMIYEGGAPDEEVEKALASFRLTASRIPAPFLLEMGRMYLDREISKETFVAVIRLVDSYLVRRALCGMDNGTLARYFPSLLRTVLKTMKKTHQDVYALTVTSLVEYNRGKANVMPSDEQLKASLREMNAYSLMVIRPVLERIEHDGATAKVDTSDLNIEHIMPQHPNAWWKKHSGASSEDEYAVLANLIGNLTLCSTYDNTRMGNEDFTFKKKVLSKTLHIRMNTEILKRKNWNKEAILKRCDELAMKIIRLYPYVKAKTENTVVRDDVLVLSSPTADARAIFHSPVRIEVLAGTSFKAYGQGEMKKMRILYNDLSSRGILHEHASGEASFDSPVFFNSLNEAAQFLMHRGGENTSAWTYEDGRRIGGTLKDLAALKKEKAVKKAGGFRKGRKNVPDRKKQVQAVSHKKNQERKKKPQKAASYRGKRNNRGFVPQSTHPKSEKQIVSVVRFAGQG